MNSTPVVFVVDDHAAARKSLCALIRAKGWTVESFVSAEQFLESYDPRVPGCLVTDFRMVGMSGLEMQEKLVRDKIQIPVIVVSGHADVSTAVRFMENGAITLLEKPYPPQRLLDAITQALEEDQKQRSENAEIDSIRERLARLNQDEIEVMQHMIKGDLNKTVANTLDISMRTVDRRRKAVLTKMEVETVPELAGVIAKLETDARPAASV